MDGHRKEMTPSFSSSLLDMIYQSIDESINREDEQPVVYRKPMTNSLSIGNSSHADHHKQICDQSGCSKNLNDDHMVVRPKSAAGLDRDSFFNSSISSSACRYIRSSSEAEKIYGFSARPKPIRTNIIIRDDECNTRETNTNSSKFVKTKKLRGMKKIYGYLKEQPVSPGGRKLATFFITLFRMINTKKTKIPSGDRDEAIVHANMKSESSSSATSFSQTSSRKALTNDVKKAVRPRPLGHEPLDVGCNPSSVNQENIKKHFRKKNRNVQDTIMKNYQRKVGYVFDSIKSNVIHDDDDDDDDVASYASSDLFELDHLSAIGMGRCMQELPLYETTSVDVNRAIANGLLA